MKLSILAGSGKTSGMEEATIERYLKACMANAAHDYFQALRAKHRDVLAAVPLAENTANPSEVELDRKLVLRQIADKVEGSPRDKAVFALYYDRGWTAKEIAALPAVGLTTNGVVSLLNRMTTGIRIRLGPKRDNSVHDTL